MKAVLALFMIIAAIIGSSPARAQWSEPVRISEVCLLVPRAVAVGETLHVVAYTGTRTYYLRSPDNGESWTEAIAPADTFYGGSQMPDIAYSNGLLHICFVGDVEDSYRQQIFVLSSSDGGRTWWRRRRVFNNSRHGLKGPNIAVNGDTLFLACQNEGSSDGIRMFRSLDNGESWPDSIVVESERMTIPQMQTILYSDNRVHIVMPYNIPNDSIGYEVYYRVSSDYGLTWSDRVALSTEERYPSIEHSQEPSAAVDDRGDIIATWFDYKYGSACGFSGDILGRVSTDNGNTWLSETRLTYTQTGSGSGCMILNGTLHVAWRDELEHGCGYPKISYSESADWGWSWQQPVVISGSAIRPEVFPILINTISLGDTVLHCFFAISTNDGYWIYYMKRDGATGVCESNASDILPAGLEVTAYPNPFNSTVTIGIVTDVDERLNISIYNVMGQQMRSFDLEGKEGKVIWDGTDSVGRGVASGIYIVKVVAGAMSKEVRLVYIK